jgi:hypothetical protein
MNRAPAIIRNSYKLGWLFLALAFLYRLAILIPALDKLALTSPVAPRNLLQLAGVSFLICAATYAHQQVAEPREAPKAVAARAGSQSR